MPIPQIQNAAGAFGEAALTGYTGDDRTGAIINMVTDVATITRGDLVALSTANPGRVTRALVGTNPQLVIGVALDNEPNVGGTVPVCVAGPCYGVKKDGTAITAGDAVGRSGATAATVVTVAPATGVTTVANLGSVLGIAMSGAIAGAATVDVFLGKF